MNGQLNSKTVLCLADVHTPLSQKWRELVKAKQAIWICDEIWSDINSPELLRLQEDRNSQGREQLRSLWLIDVVIKTSLEATFRIENEDHISKHS